MRYLRYIILIYLLVHLYGCLLHPPYDKAAVVIYNETSNKLSYSVFSADSWSEPANINDHDADFVMLYDIITTDEMPPVIFEKIRIATHKCNIVLDRQTLEKQFNRDPDGRKGWNLYINEKLLKNFGCDNK